MQTLLYGLPLFLVRYGYGIRSRSRRDGHLAAEQTSVGRGYSHSAIPRYGGAFPSRTTRKVRKSNCRGRRGDHTRHSIRPRSLHPAQQLYGKKFVSCNHLFYRRKGRHCLHHSSGSKTPMLYTKHLQRPTTAIHILRRSQ